MKVIILLSRIKEKEIIPLKEKLLDEILELGKKFNKTIEIVSDLGNQINAKHNIDNTFVNNLKEIDYFETVGKNFGIYIYNANHINDDLDSGIISNLGLFYSISNFFKYLFKEKYEELSDYLRELKKKINSLILDKKKIFLCAYENFKDEILQKYETVLYLQSTDLTRISEQNFEKAKDLFNEAIELLKDKD